MSLTNSPFWMAPTGADFYDYSIDNSLRFNAASNHYLSRTLNGNRKTFTVSFWYKRAGTSEAQIFTSGSSSAGFVIASNSLEVFNYSGGYQVRVRTQRLFRDFASWYHIVVRFDTTQSTASNRVRIYVNGEQETSFIHSTYPSQNYNTLYMNNTNHRIGQNVSGGQDVDGYLANFELVDGLSLGPTSFGETKSGIWIPKEYTGSYGTAGFHLEFNGNASDSSGNGNNWTANNFSSHDYVLDSPTNNYPIVNIITGRGGEQFTEGGLVRYSDPSGYDHGSPTFALPKSGKWYIELMPHSQRSSDPPGFGFGIAPTNSSLTSYPGGNSTDSYAISPSTGGTTVYNYKNGSYLGTSYNSGVTFTISSTVVQIAVDMDSGKFWFGFNNTFRNTSGTSANPSNGTNPSYTLTAAQLKKDMEVQAGRFTNDSGRWTRVAWNFGQDGTFAGLKSGGTNTDENGQGNFQYTPPTGFLALCSANLPAPAIDPAEDNTPEDNFNTLLYSGNSATTHAITGLGFQPDWVWLKVRNESDNHVLTDGLRGTSNPTGARYFLQSNNNNAENSGSFSTNRIKAFGSDGFTVGTSDKMVNASGDNYVAWCWKGGNTAGVSNTDGSVTTTVSANPEAGFSIVRYSGSGTTSTFGHGLGTPVDCMIIKRRNAAANWIFKHKDLPNYNTTGYMQFDTSIAYLNDPNAGLTGTTDTTFTISNSYGTQNNSSGTYIAYCFSEREGFSKFGFYEGNGSADGVFVYTGFRPAWIIVKRTNGSGVWTIYDNKRDPDNLTATLLEGNTQDPDETNSTGVDFLSNGIKMRNTFGGMNNSSGDYIYMAFAEQPLKYSNAR